MQPEMPAYPSSVVKMRPGAWLAPWLRFDWVALWIWTVLVVGICFRVALWPGVHDVFPIFADAGTDWLDGGNIYRNDRRPELDFFRYSPLIAVLLTPFSLLGDSAGGVCWRLVSVGVLGWGFSWWCRRVLPGGESFTGKQRALLWLLLLPLSIPSLNNGQANVLVLGLLLAGVAGAAQERWNLSAACVALACLFKVYPLAHGLLLIALYPWQYTFRFVGVLAAGLLLPFLFQHPAYVAEMYQNWSQRFIVGDRHQNPLPIAYRDLWLLFRLYFPIRFSTYLIVQLTAAAGVAAVCLAGRCWGHGRRRQLTVLTLLGISWMLLCGPATESCTYTLLAPALAFVAFDAWQRPRSLWTRGGVLVIFGLFAAKPLLGGVPVLYEHHFAFQPLATLMFVGLVMVTQVPDLFQRTRQGEEDHNLPALAA